jgi:2-polyprenyl-3-methyl-5-hydroxy-6-metoxy-1,4-benzoquinol methylase
MTRATRPPELPAGVEAPVPVETIPCVLCGSERFRTVLRGVRDRIWFKPGVYQVQQCENCALVQTRPRPVPGEALGFYYENTYSQDGSQIKEMYEQPFGHLLNIYRIATIEKVRPITPEDHVLDVGCSYGSFLAKAHEERGCAVSGVDLDAPSIEASVLHDKGIETSLHVGTALELAEDPDHQGKYSIISFLECLEHDPDPVATLEATRKLLRPGGLVLIEVPNWRSFWRWFWGRWWMPLFVPQHTVHFAPATLEKVVEKAGLEKVHHQTMLMPIEWSLSLRGMVHDLVSPRGKPPPWVDKVLGPFIFVTWFLIEFPVQFWLRAFGFAGHQALVARRPEDG